MKAKPIVIAVAVLVLIGVIVGVIVASTGKKDNKSSNKSGGNSDAQKSSGSKSSATTPANPNGGDNTVDTTLTKGNSSSSGSGSTMGNPDPKSDPEEAKPALTMLAIGDWGATTDKPGSCCSQYRKVANGSLDMKIDYWSQINVAEILAQSAGKLKPKVIIGHGDNIYWNGVGPDDAAYRMETTFESVYSQPELKDIPWVNVVGNHDLGGSMFICGDKDYRFRECKDTAEMLKYLDAKFDLQAQYVSPNGNRWKMPGHYFVHSVEAGDVSVDIFNIDTNFAESHGMRQICCQCYGYVNKAVQDQNLPEAEAKALRKTCNDQKAGDKLCAGGDVGMFQACSDKIEGWWKESMTKVQEDLKKSTATYKVINSHYSPHFHMSTDKMKAWYKICKDNNVHLWLNGHTHGFNHDISVWGTHFFENGAGGGIQSETSGHPPEVAEPYVKHQWIAPGAPYGFFELSFSKDWIRMEWVTFDEKWVFSTEKEQIVKGGMKKGHCWHVPVTVGKGKECKSNNDKLGAPGAPPGATAGNGVGGDAGVGRL